MSSGDVSLHLYPQCMADIVASMSSPYHVAVSTCTDAEFAAQISKSELTNEARFHLSVSRRMGMFVCKITREISEKCPLCWVTKPFCYCSQIPRVHTAHQFYVFMHYKEFMRTSNTGKLLLLSVDGKLMVTGFDEHEQTLAEVCSQPNTCIVYPDPEALSVHEFYKLCRSSMCGSTIDAPSASDTSGMDGYQAMMDADASKHTPDILLDYKVPMNFVFLDATWGQARTLVSRLAPFPALPYVKLCPPEDFEGLFSPLRRQSHSNRVSTLEAGLMLLCEMGLSKAKELEVQRALRYHVDIIRRLSHRQQVYGSFRKSKREKKMGQSIFETDNLGETDKEQSV
jgi:DTW domain-containing protein YfiP